MQIIYFLMSSYGKYKSKIIIQKERTRWKTGKKSWCCHISHSEDRASSYILIIKANEMHYFSN